MKKLLLFGIILWFVYVSHARDVKMGIFLPLTGSWPTGPYMASAILIAMDKVNSDPYWLKGHNLSFVVKDDRCEAKSSLKGLVDFKTIEDPPVDVYIGPSCSVACQPGAYIAAHWNIPMISFSCGATILSNKTLFPYFVRTAGSYSAVRDLVPALLKQYNWDRMGILTSTESIFSEVGKATLVKLEKDGKYSVSFFGSFDAGETEMYKLTSMVKSMVTKARGKLRELGKKSH